MTAHNATNYKILNEYNNVQNIVRMALSITRQGYQVMPMGANKKANWHFIPFDPNNPDEHGNPQKSTNLFIAENEFPTNQQVIEWSTDWRTKGMSLITGIVTVIDIDVPRFFDMWLACDGVRDVLERRRVPLMRSGGGGYQLPFVVSVPNEQKPKTSKVAWAKNSEKDEGREIAIEVKGFTQKMTCTYVMLPGSLHPSGNLYQELDAFGGTYANIPMITDDEWNVLLSAAKSICEAPKAKSTLKREAEYKAWQAQQAKKPKPTYSRRNGESPIDRFNGENDIEDMLDKYGYSRVGRGRWSYGSNRTGKSDISIVAGKSYHYNDNDPLANMGKKGITPFDVLLCFEYGGMRSRMGEAVRDLAEGYSIDYATQYQNERQVKQANPLTQPLQQPRPMAQPLQQPQPMAQPEPMTAPVQQPQPLPVEYADFGPPPPPPIWFDEYEQVSFSEVYEPTPEELAEVAHVPVWFNDYPAIETVIAQGLAKKLHLRDLETDFERFDWDVFKAQILADFDLERYKQEHEITSFNGGVFESVSMALFGSPNTRKGWGKVLRAAAKYAGIAWPSFRRLGWTKHDTIELAKRVAHNFKLVQVPDEQYLSDLLDYNTLPYEVNHIMAGCGIGKTRAADKLTPKTFFTPMSRQAEAFTQSANARGADGEVVCEGYMHQSQNVVYGTYDAAKKEIAQLSDVENPLSLAGRTVIIDEVQHVETDGYRKKSALKPLINLSGMYLSQGGRVITLTGTPTPLLPNPIGLAGSNVLVFERVDGTTRNLYLFRESDPVEAIKALIDQGYTHFTYTIDNRKSCEFIAQALNEMDIKAYPIHSHNKHKDFHKSYTGVNGNDGVWAEGVQVYVTTRATVDGFSVIMSDQKVKLAEMFDKSLMFGSGMVEQRSRRVRNYSADVYIGLSDEALKMVGAGGHFDLLQEIKDQFELADVWLDSAKRLHLARLKQLERDELIYGAGIVEDANKQALEYVIEEFKGRVIINGEGELIIDELGVIQKVSARWAAKANANPDIMVNELESYDFEYQGLVNLTGNKDDAKARIEAQAEIQKAIKESELADIKEESEKMSDTQVGIVLENVRKVLKEEEKGKAKVSAAGLRRNFVEMGLSSEGAKEQVQELTSVRKDVIKRIEGQTRLAKIRRAMSNPEYMKRADDLTRFFGMLQDGQTFQLGEILTSDEVRDRVTVAAKACNVPEILTPYAAQEKKRAKKANKELDHRYTSNNKIMRLIKDIYQVERSKKQVGDEWVNAHAIIGFREIKLAKFKPIEPIAIEPEPTAPDPIPALELVGEIEPRVYEALKRLYDSAWIDHEQFIAQIEQAKYHDEFNVSWQ